jgi:hypothetical protein
MSLNCWLSDQCWFLEIAIDIQRLGIQSLTMLLLYPCLNNFGHFKLLVLPGATGIGVTIDIWKKSVNVIQTLEKDL